MCFLFSASLPQRSCPHPSETVVMSKHTFWEPIKVHDIRWNFEKFLVGPDGVPVMRWFHHTPVRIVQSDIMEYLNQTSTQ